MPSSWGTTRLRLLIVILVSFASVGPVRSEERRVTLATAKEYAVSHNFLLEAQRLELRAAEAGVRAARSAFYPRFSLVVGAESLLGSSASETTGLGYLRGTLNVFNGFLDRSALDNAALERDRADLVLRQKTLEVELDVERYFYLFLFKRQSLRVYEESLKINDRNREAVRGRRASGLATESDVMDFALRDSLLRSQIASLEKDVIEARFSLLRLLGPNLGPGLEPIGDLPHFHLKDDLAHYRSRLEERSYPVRLQAIELAQAGLRSRTTRSGWLPRIDLEGQAGYLDREKRIQSESMVYRGVVLAQWEFFSGFETHAKLQMAAARTEAREMELRQQLLTAMTNVEMLYQRLRSIEERIDLEAQNEERARKLNDSIWREYIRGAKFSGDVKDAQQSLLEARIRNAEFKLQYLEQKQALEKELGGTVELVAVPDDRRAAR